MRLLFIVFFTLIIHHTSAKIYQCEYQKNSCGCSRKAVNTRDINQSISTQAVARSIGSEIPVIHSWSWAVYLNISGNYHCAGSILNEWYIITAAHCLQNILHTPSNITVCAGTDRLSHKCHHLRSVDQIINHPAYKNDNTYKNDIALLRLTTPLDLNNSLIARICLPDAEHHNNYPKPGTDVIAVGWGATEKLEISTNIRQVKIKIISNSAASCKSLLNNSRLQLCAGAPEKDTCQGDSGGPLMVFTASRRWELVGLTSYGKSCTYREYIGAYTRVTHFRSFINQTLQNGCSCECPRGKAQGVAYTTDFSLEACVDACKTISSNSCVVSNIYACRNNDCRYSSNYTVNDTGRDMSYVHTFPNGRYVGQLTNYATFSDLFSPKTKKRHGIGTFYMSSGSKYTGDWINNKQSGRGVYTWADGRKYAGDWVNGDMTGRGVFIWTNGKKYSGGWINDTMTGHGVYTFSNGNRFDGQFKNNMANGKGTYYYANGSINTDDWIDANVTDQGVWSRA